MRNKSFSLLLITYIVGIACTALSSCYRDTTRIIDEQHDALVPEYSEKQLDSISFYSTHHFTNGYNFEIYSDSIALLVQQPEELVSQLEIDTFQVYENHQVVVGDIRIIPQDSIDSVWVQLATDEGRFGWIHETELLPNVVPVDPISQFIMFFSSSHIIIFLFIMAILGCAYYSRKVLRQNAPIVHLRDIPSFYPTLLCLIVATSATFYASLQMFAPEAWRHFYYHPSLNPLQLPFLLSIFISSVWAMLIVIFAAIEEVRHNLPFKDAVLYMAGLIGMCAVDYIVFSLSTLIYIGYPLLAAYYWFAIRQYKRNSPNRYICGNCGTHLPEKGRCPNCGAINE